MLIETLTWLNFQPAFSLWTCWGFTRVFVNTGCHLQVGVPTLPAGILWIWTLAGMLLPLPALLACLASVFLYLNYLLFSGGPWVFWGSVQGQNQRLEKQVIFKHLFQHSLWSPFPPLVVLLHVHSTWSRTLSPSIALTCAATASSSSNGCWTTLGICHCDQKTVWTL